MDIYWIKSKERQGPASVIDVVSFLEEGELTESTKAWHKGCEQWVPMSELPALVAHFQEAETQHTHESEMPHDIPSDVLNAAPPLASMPTVPLMIIAPAPVLRFWARLVDLLLYTVVYLGVLRLFNAHFNMLYFSPLMWIPYCLLEAGALHIWKMTPGKWLMGIRVTNLENHALSFSQANKRCFLVLSLGMGFMLGWITLIMAFFAWLNLRKTLISYWDRKTPSLIQSTGKGGAERIIIAAVSIYILFQIFGWLLMPWSADIMSLSQDFPDFLKW